MLRELKHPAVHPVPLPEVILPFSLVSYWSLNLPEFTAWHMNVNCILWLFMLARNVVKSSSVSLLLLSLCWQRDKANSWGQLNWAPVLCSSCMFFWNGVSPRKCDSNELPLCRVSVGTSGGEAALHRERLCNGLSRSTWLSGFQRNVACCAGTAFLFPSFLPPGFWQLASEQHVSSRQILLCTSNLRTYIYKYVKCPHRGHSPFLPKPSCRCYWKWHKGLTKSGAVCHACNKLPKNESAFWRELSSWMLANNKKFQWLVANMFGF